MRESSRTSGQSGFSLLELIVAMAVTMVVTGAVYGLMAGGNNAFRREPELTDRQQNARVAMDMIQRDITNAGTNLGVFFQAFTRNLDGAGRVDGPSGAKADHLEIFGNDGTCPDAPTVKTKPPGPTSGVNINVRGSVPSCYSEESLVLVLYSNGGAKWGLAHNIHSKDSKDVNFPGGKQPTGTQIDGPAELESFVPGDGTTAVAMSPLQLVRYEIATDPPGVAQPAGVPSLWRSATGGRDPLTGTYYEPTSAGNVTLGRWQLLARGIEDLQVQYRSGNGVWTDNAPAVGCAGDCKLPTTAEYNTPIREVRVTMSARASGYNLQGQTTSSATGRANAVRGAVTTVTSVKALQSYLAAVPPTPNCPACPVWR